VPVLPASRIEPLCGLAARLVQLELVDWKVSADSSVVRAHQHATNLRRDTGPSSYTGAAVDSATVDGATVDGARR
jgi:hypothetical protein